MIDSGKVAEILENAADLLEVHGWCQDRSRDDEGRMCAMGALYQSTFGPGVWECPSRVEYDTEHGYLEATRALNRKIGTQRSIPGWNDNSERTADEVIEAIKATAKDIRNSQKEQ